MMVAAMSDAPLFASLKKKVPYTLIKADCVEAMQDMPDASVDAVVCDPPAGIAFMGKEWDKDKGGRDGWVAWMTEVMCEALRVLKPGGQAVVWALPRTSHWTALALEDAGFEVRDAVLHCFGTGFPKSANIALMIDKMSGAIGHRGTAFRTAGAGDRQDLEGKNGQTGMAYGEPITDAAKKYQGWGSALKPSQEIWWLCRKPLDGTLAANTLKHGVGGLNIDGCRVGSDTIQTNRYNVGGDMTSLHGSQAGNEYVSSTHTGRWPSNLLLSHSPSCVHLDTADDTDLWACVPGCPVRAMDAQSGPSGGCAPASGPTLGKLGKHGIYGKATGENMSKVAFHGKVDGASRFFMRFDPNDAPFIYQAKANTKDRSAGMEGRNSHPTVKSTALMAYLCRLVTPPGGVVLDPFMGSGSTGVAALREGFRFIGIEREQEYFDIATQRIEHAAKADS